MRNKKLRGLCVSILTIILLAACAAMQSGYAPPPRHPEEEGEDLRNCTDCHDMEEAEIPYDKFNHGLYYADDHRQVAGRFGSVCAGCHRASFCADCHGMEALWRFLYYHEERRNPYIERDVNPLSHQKE